MSNFQKLNEVVCTSHQRFEQDCVKVIWALLLSVVDCDEVSVLVDAQSLETQSRTNT